VYQLAMKFPKPVKELLMGIALGGLVIANGFRNGGRSASIRQASRNLWNEFITQRGARKAIHQFDTLKSKRGLKLHLGCGGDVRTGWVNVDSFVLPVLTADHLKDLNTVAIQYDLRQPMPLSPDSCDYVYSSHFFEHLHSEDGYRLMQDCYRFLAPNGVFRIVLPDMKSGFKAYVERDEKYFDLLREKLLNSIVPSYSDDATLADYINYFVYQHGEHKCIYDAEKLTQMLTKIGFRSVVETQHKPEVDPTDPLRVAYSFYVEAVK
jgi:predicted SAM-dependent methyltransferase